MAAPTPPGWYPDPSGRGGRRYWDGRQWGAAEAPRRSRGAAPVIIVVGILGVVGFLYWMGSRYAAEDARQAESGTTLEELLSPEELSDAEFMALLSQDDIPVGGDEGRDDLIAAGRGVCEHLSKPGANVGTAIIETVKRLPSLSAEQSGALVGSAVRVYCPELNPIQPGG